MAAPFDVAVEHTGSDTAAARPKRVDVIINARSGVSGKDAAARHAAEYLAARGMHVHLEIVRTAAELLAVAERSASGDADTVVAGGGDGTIAAVAAKLLDTNKVLGVLPLGTFNYFAQRLGVPLDLDAALEILAAGEVARISVGEVNGRLFLNNSSIGLYPAV